MSLVLDADARWEVLHGDCLDLMRGLPDESIDAGVMDPPSGIKFMGKSWDSDRGGADAWSDWLAERLREVWRVLKPGGFILVWALPRTAHWTARAIDLAGFEIRDRIHDFAAADDGLNAFWESLDDSQREALARIIDGQASPVLHHLFGSGFPKSLDVAKAFDKAAGVEPVSTEPATLGMARNPQWNDLKTKVNMPPATTEAAVQWEGWGTALKPAAEHWIKARKPLGTVDALTVHRATGWDLWHSSSGVSKKQRKEKGWPEGVVRHVAKALHPGAVGWEEVRDSAGAVLERTEVPYSAFTMQSATANVLGYGVGGINLDACRVGTNAGWNYPNGRGGKGCFGQGTLEQNLDVPMQATKGRHPAHTRMSHAPGCQLIGTRKVAAGVAVKRNLPAEGASQQVDFKARSQRGPDQTYAGADGKEEMEAWACVPGCPVAALDEQSGVTQSGQMAPGTTRANRGGFTGAMPAKTGGPTHADKGGASRYYTIFPPFYYTPKPSSREKNAGCGELPVKEWREGAVNCTPRSGQIYEQMGRLGKPRKNNHPTVKPVKLMRWLVRLVCPPGGVVVDPFCGSGTTGVATLKEGARFIGLEREAPYHRIAVARLEHLAPQEALPRLDVPVGQDPAMEGFGCQQGSTERHVPRLDVPVQDPALDGFV